MHPLSRPDAERAGWTDAASDIDLLVTLDCKKNRKAYSLCWDEFQSPTLELHVYTVRELEASRGKGSLLDTAMRECIVVWQRKASR